VKGVNVDNITISNTPPSNIPDAMASHYIDAMVGSEPWAVNTENLCGNDVHELGNSSGLGSTFPIVLVASEKALNERPEAIKAVVKALDQSNQFIMENWDDAMEICASRTGLSITDQSRCSAMQFFEVGFNETDVLSMNMTAQVLLDFGNITTLPDVMAHVELSFLLKD